MPEKYIKASDCEKYFYEHLDDVHIAGAMNAIDEIPAADVVPVRHGRWKQDILRVKAALSIVAQVYICSECGKPAKMQHNFCPHCGAKMDEKECENNA